MPFTSKNVCFDYLMVLVNYESRKFYITLIGWGGGLSYCFFMLGITLDNSLIVRANPLSLIHNYFRGFV